MKNIVLNDLSLWFEELRRPGKRQQNTDDLF